MTRITHEQLAAVWTCDTCGSWWGSRGSENEASGALRQVMDRHPELSWDEYRGWHKAHTAGTPCPECGSLAVRLLFEVDISGE